MNLLVVFIFGLFSKCTNGNNLTIECKEAYSCTDRSWTTPVILGAYGYKSMRGCYCDGCALIVATGAASSEYGRKLTTSGLIQCLGAYSVCLRQSCFYNCKTIINNTVF